MDSGSTLLVGCVVSGAADILDFLPVFCDSSSSDEAFRLLIDDSERARGIIGFKIRENWTCFR